MVTFCLMPDYIQKRFEEQRDWYDRKSVYYKTLYYRSQWAIIGLSGMAPIMLVLGYAYGFTWASVLSGIMPAIVAIIVSVQQFGRWQALFIEYRTTCETLKRQWYLYDAQIGDYEVSDDKEREKVFVHHVEDLISRQNRTWVDSYRPER